MKKNGKRGSRGEMPSKTERLGMGEGPMSATTLSVQGLTPDDAVEIVRRKIQRALRANASSFKVLFLPENGKLQRKVEGYLSTVGSVREFFIDTDHPGTLWIHF